MDTIEKRIEFSSQEIQLQAIWKLHKDVLQKSKGQLNEHSTEIQELSSLFESVCSSHSRVASAACVAVLKLVEHGQAEFTFVLNSLLNLVPSVRHTSRVIKAIVKLVGVQAVAIVCSKPGDGLDYICPFGLRTSPHPLITVLINRPESCHHILDHILDIWTCSDHRIQKCAVEMFRPFFTFLLLHPDQSDRGSGQEVCRFLSASCHTTCRAINLQMVQLVLQLAPKMQISGISELRNTCCIIEQVVWSLIALLEQGEKRDKALLALCSDVICPTLELILQCLELGVACAGLIKAVVLLFDHPITIQNSTCVLFLLGELLCQPSVFDDPNISLLAKKIFSSIHNPDRLCSFSLIRPLLQCLAMPETVEYPKIKENMESILVSLLATTERTEARALKETESTIFLTKRGYEAEAIVFFLRELNTTKLVSPGPSTSNTTLGEEDKLSGWLDNVCLSLHMPSSVSSLLVNFVVSVIVTTPGSYRPLRSALKLLAKIASLVPTYAPSLLPPLLYVMNKTKTPVCHLLVLETFPSLATHKYCIPTVLRAIQALAVSPELKPLSIRLTCMLWKRQDRCFPHLLKCLKDTDVHPQVLLAKAAAIVDVCTLRPEHHGAELLEPLESILKSSSSDDTTASAALALEGLYLLCHAEVIDVKSLWTVIGARLIRDTRTKVVEKICSLLSCVPSHATEAEEYQVFVQEVGKMLWLYTQSPDNRIASAAFTALSSFKKCQLSTSSLPDSVIEYLLSQKRRATKDKEESPDINETFPSIPGHCFTHILSQLSNTHQLEGFKTLLMSLTKEEAAKMPRAIFYSLRRSQATEGSQGKALAELPKFLLQQLSKCDQTRSHNPHRTQILGGLLYCYSIPFDVDKGGQPRKHSLIKRGQSYLQMLRTMLAEPSVKAHEWHHSLYLTEAWNFFMDSVFLSQLQSRKCNLELQEKHGNASMETVVEKTRVAWLWARDSITEVIQTSWREFPVSGGNCLLALAGLALSVHRYFTSLDKPTRQLCDSVAEFPTHSHWMLSCWDSLFSVFVINYRPKHRSLLHVDQRGGSVTNPTVNSLARVAASQLVSPLMSSDSEKVLELLQILTSSLPGGSAPESGPILVFFNGLALGIALRRLFQDRFSDLAGSKEMSIVWRALKALEDLVNIPNKEIEGRNGCILGVGEALVGLCSDGKTESQVHVSSALDKLRTTWLNTAVEYTEFEAYCLTVTRVAGCMFASYAASENLVVSILGSLQELLNENTRIVGLYLSLGLLLYCMFKQGHQLAFAIRQLYLDEWTKAFQDPSSQALEKTGKLYGLLALIGSEKSAIPVEASSSVASEDKQLSSVLTLATQTVVECQGTGSMSHTAWILGHLHLISQQSSDSHLTVPRSYSYLPETSVLRYLVDFLITCGQQGQGEGKTAQCCIALECLKVKTKLPPLNWGSIFSSLMRANSDPSIKTLCISMAGSQISLTTTAATFFTSWTSPSLFLSLPVSAQIVIHKHLTEMVKILPVEGLQSYLERCCLPVIRDSGDTQLQLDILNSLKATLAMNDPPQGVMMAVYAFTGQVYAILNNEINIPLLKATADCLSFVPDDILDSILSSDFTDASSYVKASYVRCYLVATGSQPVSLLNIFIDAFFNTTFCDFEIGMWMLVNGLGHYSRLKSQMSGPITRQQWLVDLLGHTMTVVSGSMPLADTAPHISQVVSRVITIVSASVLALTYPDNSSFDLCGLTDHLFTSSDTSSPSAEEQEILCPTFTHLSHLSPLSLNSLTQQPWNSLLSKVVDWATSMSSHQDVTEDDVKVLRNSLLMLRHSSVFKQAGTWTKILQT